jgi:hypothetical protein
VAGQAAKQGRGRAGPAPTGKWGPAVSPPFYVFQFCVFILFSAGDSKLHNKSQEIPKNANSIFLGFKNQDLQKKNSCVGQLSLLL